MSPRPVILSGMTGGAGLPEGWRIDWQVMPVRGWCDWESLRIVLHPGLTSSELRCVLAHEIVHAERGPFPEWARAREERIVDAEAARRLINLDDLADALAWAAHPGEVAELLDVDHHALRARIEGLTQQERAELLGRVVHRLEGA